MLGQYIPGRLMQSSLRNEMEENPKGARSDGEKGMSRMWRDEL